MKKIDKAKEEINKFNLICPKCGHRFEYIVSNEININKPLYLNDKVKCPNCGNKFKYREIDKQNKIEK